MIGISTITANANGDIIIHENPESELKKYPARVSRSATLDGGAVITHSGFSHGDRTLRVMADLSLEEANKITRIHQTETLVNISLPDGFYSGALSGLYIDNGQVDLTILIKDKLSG